MHTSGMFYDISHKLNDLLVEGSSIGVPIIFVWIITLTPVVHGTKEIGIQLQVTASMLLVL